MNSRTILPLLLLAAASLPLYAQPVVEPITQNSDAVLLRRIWTITGNDGDYVGDGCGSVGDINGDSITDFAVHFGRAAEWRVYLGGSPAPSTEPVWVFKAAIALPTPFYGDFLGTGHKFVGFGNNLSINGGAASSQQLRLFAVDDSGVATTPRYILDPYTRNKVRIGPSAVFGMNMDNEQGDELVVAHRGSFKGDTASYRPEIWFYEGGAGFQVDTPSYVVYDTAPTRSSSSYTAQILEIDGDGHLDLVTVGQYAEGYKLKIWFGTETSPWTWTQPDREITLYNTVGIYYPIFADFDGDSKTDIAGVAGPGTINKGVFLYLSRSEHDFRILPFSLDNSDRSFSTSASTFSLTASALNDSTERVAMLPLFGETVTKTSTVLMMFSGSTTGPNGAYDAFYSTEDDGLPPGGIIGNITFSLDANNDGWQDYGTANAGWPEKQSGIAVILAGGPYIPLDQPTVSVRTEPMANHQRGLYLWPNPATTELNLAWRGDLATMPTRFSIHDIAGKLITENEIRPEHGAARWSTAAVPSGTYLLTAYDRSGKVLASTQILVQH